MLLVQIDPHSGVPVYRQIMDQVRHHLASGLLQPGQQLPSIRQLARSLAVNPTTIVKAYTELEHENIIQLERGRGAFIHPDPPAMSPKERHDRLMQLTSQLAVEARQLGIDNDEVRAALEQALTDLKHRFPR